MTEKTPTTDKTAFNIEKALNLVQCFERQASDIEMIRPSDMTDKMGIDISSAMKLYHAVLDAESHHATHFNYARIGVNEVSDEMKKIISASSVAVSRSPEDQVLIVDWEKLNRFYSLAVIALEIVKTDLQ